MPALIDPRSGLYYGWELGEPYKEGMDANLLRLGRFGFHLSVQSRTRLAPPLAPAAGDSYIVAATATGAWSGHEDQVAVWDGEAWQFATPRRGWVAFIEAEDALSVYRPGGWSPGIPTVLGTAAVVDVVESATDTTANRALLTGSGGFLEESPPQSLPPFTGGIKSTMFWRATAAGSTYPRAVVALSMRYDPTRAAELAIAPTNQGDMQAYIRIWDRVAGAWEPEEKLHHTGNTVVDSNGFLMQASPIIKLYNDEITRTDHLEIEHATLEKVDTGHYVLRGVPLLSREGWYIETPRDRNGNIYFYLDYEEGEAEGTLMIRTYEPDYSAGRAQAGDPVDILEGRFVALRFAENPALYPEPEEGLEEEGEE